MAKLLSPKELAELVSGLLIQPELLGELDDRQNYHDFILAIGNMVAQFCGGEPIAVEYHPPVTNNELSYTPMLVVNPNESLPSLLGSVWSFFDPRGWDDLPVPTGIELGQEPLPERVQTVRRALQRMLCPFACNPVEHSILQSLIDIPPNRILACLQAFEGIELERFEGKSVAQYIADEIERQNPLIEAVFTASGRIIQWNWYSADEGSDAIDLVARKYGKTVTRLYAEAPVQTQPHEDENAQEAGAEQL